jgi:hypothetical protein
MEKPEAQKARNSMLKQMLDYVESTETRAQQNILNRLPEKDGKIIWTPIGKK